MHAGLDVGAAFHVLYIPSTKQYHRIPSEDISRLIEILKNSKVDEVVLEPTGAWSIPLIEALHSSGIKVYLVHTTRFRRFASSKSNSKNDKKDAKLLSDYLKEYKRQQEEGIEDDEEKLVLFEVNDAYIESRRMWQLWKEREALTKLKVAELNRLREQLYIIDPALGKQTEAALIRSALDQDDESIQLRARRLIEINSQIKKIESQMKDLVENLPHMKNMIDLIMTVPRIGFITAYFFAMQLVDIKRFNKRSFRAFVGVGKKKEKSGISIDRTKDAKSHRTFRKLLWMAAMRLIKEPEWERYYKWHLAKTSVGKKAIWRVVSKLVNVIYGILRSGTAYDAEKVYSVVDDEMYEMAKKILKSVKRKRKVKMKDVVEYRVEHPTPGARPTSPSAQSAGT